MSASSYGRDHGISRSPQIGQGCLTHRASNAAVRGGMELLALCASHVCRVHFIFRSTSGRSDSHISHPQRSSRDTETKFLALVVHDPDGLLACCILGGRGHPLQFLRSNRRVEVHKFAGQSCEEAADVSSPCLIEQIATRVCSVASSPRMSRLAVLCAHAVRRERNSIAAGTSLSFRCACAVVRLFSFPLAFFCNLCRSFRCQEPPREVVLATLQRLWCGRWRASLPFLRRRLRRSTKLPVHLRCQPIAFVGAARTRAPPQLCSHAHGQRCVSTPGDYSVMDLTAKFGTRARGSAVVASLSAKCTARQALGTRSRFLFFCRDLDRCPCPRFLCQLADFTPCPHERR